MFFIDLKYFRAFQDYNLDKWKLDQGLSIASTSYDTDLHRVNALFSGAAGFVPLTERDKKKKLVITFNIN